MGVCQRRSNLVYTSQSGASSTESKELIREVEIVGARCSILRYSAADATTLLHELASALKTMPLICAANQGTMVLDGQIFANMSHNTLVSTLRPKVQGLWALRGATLSFKQLLDLFILLSSVASFIWKPRTVELCGRVHISGSACCPPPLSWASSDSSQHWISYMRWISCRKCRDGWGTELGQDWPGGHA